MSLPEALLNVLNNDGEPLNKRLKIADRAFKASEFQLHHKKALLLKWVLNNSTHFGYQECWAVVSEWLASKEFKDITQNDISSDDILAIITLLQNKLLEKNVPAIEKDKIVESVSFLLENRVFQQYFKYSIKLYCQVISLCLETIKLPLKYVDFVTRPFVFSKNILVQENFSQHFLTILYPVLGKKVLEFAESSCVFPETVKLIQKCLLQRNAKQFQTFIDQVFDGQEEEPTLPKSVFKYLISTLREVDSIATSSFRLLFSAFIDTFKEPHLSFKLLIFLMELLQFDTSKDFDLKIPFKRKNKTKLSKSLNVLLGILDVISTKNFPDCTVANISLTEFVRTILRSIISLGVRNSIIFEIILKCILINPLVVESLATNIIFYLMLGNNNGVKEIYEKVVVAIFEVFAKLHRIENLIAKIIPALKSGFTTDTKLEITEKTYGFEGEQDLESSSESKLHARDIFTNNILQCFTRCVNGLASWQVINLFKTLLHHLKTAVNEFHIGTFGNDTKERTFLEILGILSTSLLQSVKIADHTVPQNVVIKFENGLEELKDILKEFGSAILKKHHNPLTMRTFLSLSYTWAEVYVALTYYSINNEVKVTTVVDKTYSAANLKYLHSYMDIKEWQLIVQRITNFGENPCKTLLQKLYIQKLRAMLLLEKNVSEEIIISVVKSLQAHLDDTWRDLLLDRFTVNLIVPKMDKPTLIFLAEHLIEADDLFEKNHIKDSIVLTNAMVYVVMSKINKLFKIKRKHDAEQSQVLSSKVLVLCPDEVFFNQEEFDITEVISNIMDLHENWKNSPPTSIASKEDKLQMYLRILKKMPYIYSNVDIQKILFLYLLSLSMDILSISEGIRKELEDLIIGTLQSCKYPVSDIFAIKHLGAHIFTNFKQYDVLLTLMVDNIFKHEKSIPSLEPLVLQLINNMEDSKHLNACLLILQAVNKVKKSKMDSSSKEKANQYREEILEKMSKLVCKPSSQFTEAYAICLKYHLSLEKEQEPLNKLLEKLDSYIEYSFDNVVSDINQRGIAILFTTILQNKTKIKSFNNDMVLKMWNSCKKNNMSDDYSHLIRLIASLIPNEQFDVLVKDLFDITQNSINNGNHSQLSRQLKTWESILTCDVNPTKMKIWQEVLQKLTYELVNILKVSSYNDELYKNIVHFEQSIIQAQHFIVSSPVMDMFIMTISVLMQQQDEHFELVFNLSISTLEALLKHRNAMIMDRLPAFLQQYRVLLKSITIKSDSNEGNMQAIDVKTASNCSHNLEKLTKNLVVCKKDMGRIAVFLIADILELYEQTNLYPNVKLHLNNCVYSLISLCDHHAVSYLMRALSNASTEMFKIMYDHYKKYYMFTGKV